MLPSPWGTQKSVPFKKHRESLRDRKRRLAVYSYAVLPRVFDMLRSKDTPLSLVIVVSPLVKDQVSTLTRRNVSAVYLRGSGDEEFAAMCDGKLQLVFMSQELDWEERHVTERTWLVLQLRHTVVSDPLCSSTVECHTWYQNVALDSPVLSG